MDALECYYLSPYARIRLLPEGMMIFHTNLETVQVIRGEKKQIRAIWQVLEQGVKEDVLKQMLTEMADENRDVFQLLLLKGLIE